MVVCVMLGYAIYRKLKIIYTSRRSDGDDILRTAAVKDVDNMNDIKNEHFLVDHFKLMSEIV